MTTVSRILKPLLPYLIWIAIAAIAVSVYAPKARAQTPTQTPGEAAVIALPGIGAGWLDTLRAVAGSGPVDTLPTTAQLWCISFRDGVSTVPVTRCLTVGGLYDNVKDIVYVHPHVEAYDLLRATVLAAPTMAHPPVTANPAGILAHEFGHRFQLTTLGGSVYDPAHPLPEWAVGNGEVFADRFAVAMLALRGTIPAVADDSVLNRIVAERLAAGMKATRP